MSQADIDSLHRDLVDLHGESHRQQKNAKAIAKRAAERLDEINQRLGEISSMDESAEYQCLIQERGVLAQMLETGDEST